MEDTLGGVSVTVRAAVVNLMAECLEDAVMILKDQSVETQDSRLRAAAELATEMFYTRWTDDECDSLLERAEGTD